MPHHFHRQLLRDTATLADLTAGKCVSASTLHRRLFVAEWRESPEVPDHALKALFQHNLAELHGKTLQAQEAPWRSVLLASVKALGDHYLLERSGGVEVRPERFLQWQDALTDLAPLLLQVDVLRRSRPPRAWSETAFCDWANTVVRRAFEYSTLPTVADPVVESVIADGGLVESHMHLNGTTEVDLAWADTLLLRRTAMRELFKVAKKREVQELYEQIEPGLHPARMAERLRIARRIRWWLWAWSRGWPSDVRAQRGPVDELFSEASHHYKVQIEFDRHFDQRKHPMQQWLGPQRDAPQVLESAWLAWTLQKIEDREDSAVAARLLVLYLQILHANFLPLCVQQRDQKGFDQFQKLTLDGVREATELQYKLRFRQLQYRQRSDLRVLEGRFAPKDDGTKMRNLLRTIIAGYEQKERLPPFTPRVPGAPEAVAPKRPFELLLVAHLIKSKDKGNEDNKGAFQTCRHQAMRRQMELQVMRLLTICSRDKKIGKYVVGLDAASNELDAPPEVLAPAYRQARRGGIRHFSYHVGEDFRHLLSGIRAVYEAVEFLDLRGGDRLGHATAIGIDPKLWLRNTTEKTVISKIEWLDNLVFAHEMLMNDGGSGAVLGRLASEIAKLSREVYDEVHDPALLHDAWKLRRHDPLRLPNAHSPAPMHLDAQRQREEYGWLDGRVAPSAGRFRERELWHAYHGPEGRRRGRQLMTPDTKFLDEKHLLRLQQLVLKEVAKRMVAIEVPVTSNLRIAPYKRYDEHHLFRWLGLEGEDEPRPLVCLASDDPGIFATNMRNELVAIHEVLHTKYAKAKPDCRSLLATLNAQALGLAFRQQATGPELA